MEEQFKIRLEKLKKIEDTGVEGYPYEFKKTHRLSDIISKYRDTSNEELEKLEETFAVAGRIMSIRKMGKSAFVHIFDGEEQFQIYIRKNQVPEKDFEIFTLLDIGDIIGVSGRIFVTKTRELTLMVSRLTFLTKSLHPLPEKWHGLQDKELRYRQRYLDLIVNSDARKSFRKRSLIIQEIRAYFFEAGYLEVETPMMQPIPGGATAKPFITRHNALNIDLYLRVAPELYLKRLLVGGMEKIFEINRNFRNEGISQMHNPEFTMIEFYELYKDFEFYMEFTENLFQRLNDKFLENNTITWQEREISLKPPFKRGRFMDLIMEKSGIAADDLWDEERLTAYIKKHIPQEEMPPTFGKKIELMFDHYVEASLEEPIFITHYPKVISPFSKRSREDDRLTERFELFIAGMELANGFSELNDPLDQRQRFEAQLLDRGKGDEEMAQTIDQDFLRALEQGMPPAAGEGLGIDRLVMLYTGNNSIKEVILFPLLKPKE